MARRKISILEEFLRTWRKQLEEMEPNELVSRISQEILRYEVIFIYVITFCFNIYGFQGVVPLLKYVKGEDFSDKHWFDTFNLLGIEVKPLDQLTVYDLFKQSKNIELYSKELQVKKMNSSFISFYIQLIIFYACCELSSFVFFIILICFHHIILLFIRFSA